MISFIRGKLIEKNPTSSIVDCQGIGFLIHTPLSTSQRLGSVGDEVNLYIQSNFERNGLELFGFATNDEKAVFNILRAVPGIGPRAALNLLSRLETKEIKETIAQGKVEILKTIPGIGKKKAEMIIFKLKEHLTALKQTEGSIDLTEDAVKALTALGLNRKEAMARLKKIPDISKLSLDEILRQALK